MKNQIHRQITGKPQIVSILVMGVVGLLLIALWWSGTSTVLAQEGGESESEHTGVSDEIGSEGTGTKADDVPHDAQGQALSDEQLLRCIDGLLGRIPLSANDFTNEEKLAIAERCLGGLSGGGDIRGVELSPTAGGLDSQDTQCIIQVLGRVPSDENDLTDDEKRAVGERCFSERNGTPGRPSDRSDDSGGRDDLNDEDRQCIISVLGRMPEGPDDLTSDEKRLLGQQCFPGRHDGGAGGASGSGGPGDSRELDEETHRCIDDTIGRLPLGPDDLSHEEKQLIGQACFGGGHQGPNGPGDLDDETLECIVDTIGRLPSGPDDLTNEEERLIGQACFGGGQHGPGGPGDLDEETLQCIVATIGRLPSGPDDLTLDEKRLIGQACFGGHPGGPDGPGDLDEETLRCIVDLLGYLPSGPDDLTDAEKQLVGRECFGGDHGGPGDLDEETVRCIIDLLGYLPSGPDDLTHEEKRLVGQECFEADPDDLDEETRKCIVNILGYLPAGPEELSDEEMNLVMRECFQGEHEGPGDPLGLDEVTTQCIIDLVGRIPASANDLTTDEKRLIGRE